MALTFQDAQALVMLVQRLKTKIAELESRLEKIEKEPQIIRQYVGGGISKSFADTSYLRRDGSTTMTGDLKLEAGKEIQLDDLWGGKAHIKFDDVIWGFDFYDDYGDKLSIAVYELHLHRELLLEREAFITRLFKSTSASWDFLAWDGAAYQRLMKFYAGAIPYVDIPSAGDFTMLDQKMMQFGTYTDAQRPAAGTAGRWIFNTDDGMPNYDDGVNWRDINGNIT